MLKKCSQVRTTCHSKAILKRSTIIAVFFDPIGQALTARTMDVIERLSKKHNEKLKFYMSKADQVSRASSNVSCTHNKPL
jgi:hypothetical protein